MSISKSDKKAIALSKHVEKELEAARTYFLKCIEAAWKKSAAAYDNLEINSERCLQANIYHELKKQLHKKKNSSFNIYIEPRISPHKAIKEDPKETPYENESRKYIDTAISYTASDQKRYLIAGVEFKFTSRGYPIQKNIRKDLETLSHLMDPKNKIIIQRISADQITINITKQTIAILCAFYNHNKFDINHKFFNHHRPREAYTNEKWVKSPNWRTKTLPYRLHLLGAATPSKNQESKTKTKQVCNQAYDTEFNIR